jgi:hypothetical protein
MKISKKNGKIKILNYANSIKILVFFSIFPHQEKGKEEKKKRSMQYSFIIEIYCIRARARERKKCIIIYYILHNYN